MMTYTVVMKMDWSVVKYVVVYNIQRIILKSVQNRELGKREWILQQTTMDCLIANG